MAGHPQTSFTTNHFEAGELKPGKSNRRYWKCKYCGDDEDSLGAKLEGRDNVLPNHISDTQQCPNAPATARNDALRHMSEKKSTKAKTASKQEQDEDISIIDVDAEAPVTKAKSTTGVAVAIRKRRFGTLDSYVDTTMSTAQKNAADRKLLRVDDPYLDEFLHDLRPSYDSPGQFPLTHTLLDAEAADAFLCEADRLQSSKFLTLLEDGWEDRTKHSIYGTVAAGIDSFPIIMALNDLMGERGNAPECLDIAIESLCLMGDPNAKNFIGLTTHNPTTMQSFRRLFQEKYFWILTFTCFLHSLNTLIGDICVSHYWGGQLQAEAKHLAVTRGLKKNCETRWYALILLCLSVICHQQPLSLTCLRPDAQKKTRGLSPVSPDVIQIVLHTPDFWLLLAQLTRVTKPIVDAIGNCESRQATLADCILELICCARTMSKMSVEENEDEGFLHHAKETFNQRFKMIATPIHWLALFLHPLCQKLAVSNGTAHGPSLDFMCKSPFSGGQRDAREWWKDVPKENHDGIRLLGLVLASIMPHAGDVEQLFSDLGGIQTPRRNNMTVATMEKTGKIRSRLKYELYLKAKQHAGNMVHRKHNHMHMQATPDINADLAKDLENPITTIEDEEPAPATPGSIIDGKLVDFAELDRVNRGEAVTADENNMDVTGDGGAGSWSIEELMDNKIEKNDLPILPNSALPFCHSAGQKYPKIILPTALARGREGVHGRRWDSEDGGSKDRDGSSCTDGDSGGGRDGDSGGRQDGWTSRAAQKTAGITYLCNTHRTPDPNWRPASSAEHSVCFSACRPNAGWSANPPRPWWGHRTSATPVVKEEKKRGKVRACVLARGVERDVAASLVDVKAVGDEGNTAFHGADIEHDARHRNVLVEGNDNEGSERGRHKATGHRGGAAVVVESRHAGGGQMGMADKVLLCFFLRHRQPLLGLLY
ncbi:hypothetical protein DFH07DRAFT_770895 [Mycena maculata]|uniref:DUF659 domain-containing protein n=1 Tax=Mycena maculata TaxID=230809 RepID=A0AAD7NJQ1_9AGAR|nr:hypothetical protein DFH07DRAFT_770895 [Mycena maculata]